jgi:hypothetical protein
MGLVEKLFVSCFEIGLREYILFSYIFILETFRIYIGF